MGDYVRAGVGLLLTLGPLLLVMPDGAMLYVLGALALMFVAFGVRTYVRQSTTITTDDSGVQANGLWNTRVDMARLRRLKLKYFSTRRDRQRGWMQLVLRDDKATLRIDSQLDGFDDIVAQAANAALANRLPVSESSCANFAAMGFAVPTKDMMAAEAAEQAEAAEREGQAPVEARQ